MATAGKWNDLGQNIKLKTPILETLENDLNFHTMTPVQAATIPLFLKNKDVSVEACTGSGKTLAFIIPVLEILLRRDTPWRSNEIGAIIISPIRELAQQINEVLQPFLNKLNNTEGSYNFKSLALTGGTEIEEDIKNFREHGANIIIGTPGRLEYMMEYPDFKVKDLEVLVLDEADRLLDMGFETSLNTILSKLPKQRRTGLFSATQTSQVMELVRAGLRNPVRVAVKVESKQTQGVQKIPEQLENFYHICESDQKLSHLIDFLVKHQDQKIIVYFLTCASVSFFWKTITEMNALKVPLISLHGKVPHDKRTKTYQSFVSCKAGVMLCTDVASRGLDIPDVDWIIQIDPPQNPDTFIHRVGRTARMGKHGKALVYLLPSEDTYIDYLRVKKVPVQELPAIDYEDRLPLAQKVVVSDRDILDKAQIAFVSHIRAYKEHQLSYIFRLNKIDIGKLARGFCLLQLPRMPELKTLKNVSFTPVIEMENDAVKYKEKIRETKRIKQLEERNKKLKKNEKVQPNKQKKQDNTKQPLKRKQELQQKDSSSDDDDEEDLEELFKEARKIKQLKKRKITENEMEDDDNDSSDDDIDEDDHNNKKSNNKEANNTDKREKKISWSKQIKKRETKIKRREKKQKKMSFQNKE